MENDVDNLMDEKNIIEIFSGFFKIYIFFSKQKGFLYENVVNK